MERMMNSKLKKLKETISQHMNINKQSSTTSTPSSALKNTPKTNDLDKENDIDYHTLYNQQIIVNTELSSELSIVKHENVKLNEKIHELKQILRDMRNEYKVLQKELKD